MTRWRNSGGRYPGVEKPVVDGIRFDSKHESRRYAELKILERAGEIRDLELQPRIPIEIKGVKIIMMSKRYHKEGRQVVYVGDFRYTVVATGETVVEDAKGHRTDVYRLKRALVAAMGIEITEV